MEERRETITTTENPSTIETTVAREQEPRLEKEHPRSQYEKKKIIFRAYQFIWYLVILIEVFLLFRITLKALGANPSSGFVSFVYALSDPFALPFQGIFQTTYASGAIFEWSTVVAGLVYMLIGYALVHLFQMVKPTNPDEVTQVVDSV